MCRPSECDCAAHHNSFIISWPQPLLLLFLSSAPLVNTPSSRRGRLRSPAAPDCTTRPTRHALLSSSILLAHWLNHCRSPPRPSLCRRRLKQALPLCVRSIYPLTPLRQCRRASCPSPHYFTRIPAALWRPPFTALSESRRPRILEEGPTPSIYSWVLSETDPKYRGQGSNKRAFLLAFFPLSFIS